MKFFHIIKLVKIPAFPLLRQIKHSYRLAHDIEREKRRKRGRKSTKPKRLRVVLRMIKLCMRPGAVLASEKLHTMERQAHSSSSMDGSVSPSKLMPAWMLHELRFFAEKERALYPSADLIERFEPWTAPEALLPGTAYARAITSLKRSTYQVVLLAPWLKQGGADKGIIQFCRAYSEATDVLLITTLAESSPWLERIPPTVEVLALGRMIRGLHEHDAKLVLGRLLLQLSPKIIHIVQSQLGWETVLDHALSLHALDCKLLGSLFMEEIGPGRRRYGYAVDYPPRAIPIFDAILTDNEPYRARMSSCYLGHDRQLKTVYFAHEFDPARSLDAQRTRGERVLWAGRLSGQKRVDLLHSIASRRPHMSFDIFGVSELDPFTASWVARLSALPNVLLRGEFQGFESIPDKERYACLLYTTAYDGLPNVLLEAASERIPIVAPPMIGGLADLVRPDTAWCVDAPDDPESYIAALEACLEDDPTERCENALAIVRDRHSWHSFSDTLYRILDEVGVKLGAPPTSSRRASST